MSITHRRFIGAVMLALFLAVPLVSQAVASDYGLTGIAEKAYGKDTVQKLSDDPVVIAGAVAGVALSVLGIVFLILIVLAGIKWMMAQGNQDKVTEARNAIVHALIGLVIVVAAYSIVKYALDLALTVVKKSA
ncbi:MAG: hypothetical protein AAB817_01500 [Patescibacteria group bacterium]